MDGLKKFRFGAQFSPRYVVIGVVLLMVIAIMAFKAVERNWFEPLTTQNGLEMNDKPRLIFFNSYLGCECARKVYIAAEIQVDYWPEEDRMGVPVTTIDIDKRHNLRKQYDVVRAPTLILLDAADNVIYKQSDIVTDEQPLDLETFEQKIQEIMSGE